MTENRAIGTTKNAEPRDQRGGPCPKQARKLGKLPTPVNARSRLRREIRGAARIRSPVPVGSSAVIETQSSALLLVEAGRAGVLLAVDLLKSIILPVEGDATH
jgi:hypothetical protein